MTREKRNSWIAQGLAAVGMAMWIGVAMYFGRYHFATIIAVFAIPAIIYNIVCEAKSAEPRLR